MPTTTGFAAASLEPCGGCLMQMCRSSNPSPRGFHSSGLRSGKGFSNTGITEFRELNNHRRNKSRQQQQFQIVQQAAPPTFNFPDKQTVKNLETGLPDLSGIIPSSSIFFCLREREAHQTLSHKYRVFSRINWAFGLCFPTSGSGLVYPSFLVWKFEVLAQHASQQFCLIVFQLSLDISNRNSRQGWNHLAITAYGICFLFLFWSLISLFWVYSLDS